MTPEEMRLRGSNPEDDPAKNKYLGLRRFHHTHVEGVEAEPLATVTLATSEDGIAAHATSADEFIRVNDMNECIDMVHAQF